MYRKSQKQIDTPSDRILLFNELFNKLLHDFEDIPANLLIPEVVENLPIDSRNLENIREEVMKIGEIYHSKDRHMTAIASGLVRLDHNSVFWFERTIYFTEIQKNAVDYIFAEWKEGHELFYASTIMERIGKYGGKLSDLFKSNKDKKYFISPSSGGKWQIITPWSNPELFPEIMNSL